MDFMRDIKINKEFIINNIICLIIFANIIQNGIKFAFNISINIFWQYFLVIILFILARNRKKNIKVIVFSFIVIVIFMSNIVIYNNNQSTMYLKKFLLFVFPSMLCFFHIIDFKSLNREFIKYSIFNSLIYIIALFTNNQMVKNDYMTWGFSYVFCISYIYIYFYKMGKNKLLLNIIFIPLILFLIIFGNKSSIIIIICTILMSYYLSSKTNIKKCFMTIIIFIIILNWREILFYIVSDLKNTFDLDTYSVNSFLLYLQKDFSSGFLNTRESIYSNSIELIKNNPFGIGIGNFESMYGTYPHNIVLDIIVTFGIINGVILILCIIISTIKKTIEVKDKNNMIFLIFVVSNFLKLVFSKTFINDINFWLLVLVLLSLSKDKEIILN